ncbi:MAG: hypothetical protein AB8B93_16335 [Pseudomonadales bacterium]
MKPTSQCSKAVPNASAGRRRVWLVALCCAALTSGCDRSQSTPTADSEAPAAAGTNTDPAHQSTTTHRPEPTSKPLDLSRDVLEPLEQSAVDGSLGATGQDNLLPDLFAESTDSAGARTSGRVLMRDEDGGATSGLQRVEGLELKVEVPVK